MAERTRDQLLDAAEVLFLHRGVDAVSLREITAAAGVRNASAPQYHFGDRAGLVRALLLRRHPALEAARHALLDACVARPEPDLRELAGALVRPLASLLGEGEGGGGYLVVLAELTNRPEPSVGRRPVSDPADSIYRWRSLVEPLLDPAAVRRHRRLVAIQFTHGELARRARAGRSEHALFVEDLVDLVTGLLGAPSSPATRRLDPGSAR